VLGRWSRVRRRLRPLSGAAGWWWLVARPLEKFKQLRFHMEKFKQLFSHTGVSREAFPWMRVILVCAC